MPSYIVTCVEGRLNAAHKAAVAETVTRTHGDTTGAPYYFAQVTFNEVRPGNWFLGGALLADDQIFVHGTIRHGRPPDVLSDLMVRLAANVSQAADMTPTCVWVYISCLPPNQMIEFGRVLPLHGQEAEWSAALPKTEKARLEGIGIRS